MDYRIIKTAFVSASVTLNVICACYLFLQNKRKRKIIHNPPKISSNNTKARGPSNLLQSIPTNSAGIFTFEDVVNTRIAYGMDIENTGKLISKWISRGHIEQVDTGVYRKLKQEHMVTIQENIDSLKGKGL